MKRHIAISFSLGIVVSAATLYLAFRNVPLSELLSYLASINYIWVIPSAGGIPTRVTTDGGVEPCWSPDGRQIAFSSNRIYETSACIWTVTVSGSTPLEQQTWSATKNAFRK